MCSTDLPFLHPALVRRVLRGFADPEVDVVLPVARGYRQPLAAGYRTSLAGLVEKLLGEGNLRPGMLFQHCRVTQLDDDALLADPELARHDPELDSLVNVNEPDDYAAALARPEPEVRGRAVRGARRAAGSGGRAPVRAASLGAAAAAVGITLDRHIVAAVNGDQMTRDARLPLVAGDTVAFLSADAGGERANHEHSGGLPSGLCRPVGTSDGPWWSTSGTARRRARRSPSTTPSCAPTSAASAWAPGCCTGWPRPASTRSPRRRRWRSCSPRWSALR